MLARLKSRLKNSLRISIKRQLFVALASFTLFLCFSYTGVAVLVAYVTEDAVLESILSYEAKFLQAHFTKTGQWQQPSAKYIQLVPDYAHLPKLVQAKVDAANQAGRSKSEVFTPLQTHYHVMRLSDEPQGAYLIAEVSPFLVVSRLTRNLADFMLAVALLMTGGALVLAYHLTRRIASPIVQLSEEIKTQPTISNTSSFAASRRHDEIGFLARTLEQNLRDLRHALQRESIFTRDISHELRTPLTIIHNLLQSNHTGTTTSTDDQLLRSSIQDIDQIVETLLALARAENLAMQEINLLACVEHAVLALEKIAEAQQLHFILEMDEAILEQSHLVLSNPNLLGLLISNVLNNALLHGGDGVHIKIDLAADRIAISNSITASTHQYTSGLHHGKNLIKRIAEALALQIDFHASSNNFEVIIQFPKNQKNR